MPIKVLDSCAYKGTESKLPEETGVQKGTHNAVIDYGKGFTRSFVKFYHYDEPGLFYEVLAYLLAQKLNILQPRLAAIVYVPIKKIRASGVELPIWLDNYEKFPAWCTSSLSGKSLAIEYPIIRLLADRYQQFFTNSPEWYSKVSAFDEWLCNVDRNAGNVIQLGTKVWGIIDHGKIFSGASALDNLPLDMQGHNQLMLAVGLAGSTKSTEKLHSQMVLSAASHEDAFAKCEDSIKEWLEIFKSTAPKNVLEFVAMRASSGWMPQRVGRLI